MQHGRQGRLHPAVGMARRELARALTNLLGEGAIKGTGRARRALTRLADGRSHAPGGAHNSYANRHGPTIAIGVHVKRDSTEPAAHKYRPKAMIEGSTTLQSQLLVLKQAHGILLA